MILEPRVFDEDHVPRQLLHREADVATLSRAFEPALEGDPAEDILLHGPSGVGKTVLTRHTLRRLQDRADVDVAFVRVMGKSTAGVLRATLDQLGVDTYETMPTEDLAVSLHDAVDEPTIVVCDEADDLPATDALSRLADVGALSVVPICHDAENFLARLDGRVRDQLGGHQHGLDRYRVDELADILAERAQLGLPATGWGRPYLEQVADRAAGKARNAIQTLRAAAEIAGERDRSTIDAVDVDVAYDRAQTEIRAANLASLPFHHQVLYELVRDAGEIPSEQLHDEYTSIQDAVYRGRDQMPIGERDRRYKLQKLAEYDLIDYDGESRNRVYWPCDSSIHSPLDIDRPVP